MRSKARDYRSFSFARLDWQNAQPITMERISETIRELKKRNFMDQILYSIKDIKAGHHLPPFVSTNDATAIRQFSQAVNTEGHEFNRYPSDFQLWRIAKFESGQATIDENNPQLIAEGVQQLEAEAFDQAQGITAPSKIQGD